MLCLPPAYRSLGRRLAGGETAILSGGIRLSDALESATPEQEGGSMSVLEIPRFRSRLSWIGACATLVSLTTGQHAHADTAQLRTACSSMVALSTPAFKVEAAEWVAATRLPAGPAGATLEVPYHCLFRVMIDARPSTVEGT